MAQHSLRTYRQAWELKQAGLDWQRGVLCRCLTGTALIVAQLKANRAYASEAERVRAFVQAGAGCRATYFHHAKKLRSVPAPPRIPLTHTAPPVDTIPNTDYLHQLRRRLGRLGNG
jgi:hypothetical protein